MINDHNVDSNVWKQVEQLTTCAELPGWRPRQAWSSAALLEEETAPVSEYECQNLFTQVMQLHNCKSSLGTLAMSLFLILAASLSCFPLIHSVARLGVQIYKFCNNYGNGQMTRSNTSQVHAVRPIWTLHKSNFYGGPWSSNIYLSSNLEEAMAEPQPKVLNLASTIFPSSSTLWGNTCKCPRV